MHPHARRIGLGVVLLTLGVSLRLLAQGQTPTFRAGIDLIAVDVR